jgi:hypothetical protein
LEVEDNNTKAAANIFLGLLNGDRILGTSTGTSTTVAGIGSADYFRVGTAAATLGIYRHRLALTTAGTAGHTGSLRGLTVSGGVGGTTTGTASPTSDATLQTSSSTTTPARFVQWYGFGKGESINYRVTGGTSTTSQYEATLETTSVTAVNLGSFNMGQIDITTFDLAKSPTGTATPTYTDTEMTLYDSSFNTLAAWNNDDWLPASTPHPFHSELHPVLGPGTYYLALSQFNLATNLVTTHVNEAGPNDSILDYGDAILTSSSTVTHGSPAVPVSLDFSMKDSIMGSPTIYDAAKPGAYGVYWACFEVVPEPASMAVLGLGLLPFLRRRKR